MLNEIKALTLTDTVVVLRLKLGPLVASWPAFLKNCHQGGHSLAGETLRPCGNLKIKGTHVIYDVAEIDRFVNAVLAKVPHAGKTPISAMTVKIDPAKGWARDVPPPVDYMNTVPSE